MGRERDFDADMAMDNPLAVKPDEPASALEANQSAMTEDELNDLTYAFQAADMDGGGAIDEEEFSLMLAVMGCDIDEASVKRVINKAKEGFSDWLKLADEENVKKCKVVWDQYDDDKSGTMDLKEINTCIAALQEQGCKATTMSAEEIRKMASRPDGELTFDEFSTWYLKQEGLPDGFSAPSDQLGGGIGKKEKGKVAKAREAVMKPLSGMTKKVASGPQQLLQQSARMMKTNENDPNDENYDEEAAGRAMLEEEADLIFAEFVFMMRAGMISEFLPGDWQERAEDMRKLREAFDAADVDGNNELELEELEMCVISMNPKADVQPEDIKRVWDVLNPDGKEWIPFAEYVQGMVKVKRDPELSELIPMDVPNRFQLLSLLIDTPINEDQEKLIIDKLDPLEKVGVDMLKKMGIKPQTREEIGATLKEACNGRLHYLTDEQRAAVNKVHNTVMFQAFLIGTLFNAAVGLNENILVWVYETNGMQDAYWRCPEVVGDPRLWTGNVSLASCGNVIADDPLDYTSEWPICTSVPTGNVTWALPDGNTTTYTAEVDYGAKGGSSAFPGGTWTNGWEKGTNSTVMCDDVDCSTYCQPLPSSYDASKSWSEQNRLISFWVFNIIGIVIGVVFELSLLVVTAIKAAVQVGGAISLRLTPLNKDRAFVAAMLVRTAFELPDPEGEVMGVDAGVEANAAEGHMLHDILAIAYVKGKVLLTGIIGKQIALRTTAFSTFTWIGPYAGPMLSASLWDTMMCHAIMKNAEIQAIGVTTGVEVFNEIMDKFCPSYEENPESLSEKARVQILRAIGVAIVKHGSMFPTMEILLRHAVNYLNMKKSKAVASSGVIDDEEGMIDDFSEITLDECRAVLCVHMLCYVLDGSIGFSELELWKRMTERVEELYQIERAKFDKLNSASLRDFIIEKAPNLEAAVNRVPVGDDKYDEDEMKELYDIAQSVPMPEHAATMEQLIPRVICQKFRQNKPVDVRMIEATFDPAVNTEYRAQSIAPDELFTFFFNEFTFKIMSALTAQV